MKLAIAQMVLGVIILVDCLCFVLLVSPVFLFVAPALGLVVLGCGIAQFQKALESEVAVALSKFFEGLEAKT